MNRVVDVDGYCPYNEAKVYIEDGIEYNMTLSRDSAKSYYILQILVIDKGYVLWMRAGTLTDCLVDERVQIYQKIYDVADDVKNEFKKVFKGKTKQNFEKYEYLALNSSAYGVVA